MQIMSFFSGAMGLDIGLEKVGFTTKLACEYNKFCQKTIKYNKPNVELISDIWEFSPHEIKEISGIKDEFIIVGGPPCQSFSTAGKRRSLTDSRGSALIKYLEIIESLKPNYFVLENVRGIYSSIYDENNTVLQYIYNRLSHCGYNITYNLYNSMYFGVPQSRERMIMIGSLNSKLPYLIPTTSNDDIYGLSNIETFRNVSGNIPYHNYIQFPEKRLKYYKFLKEGENWKNLPPNIKQEAMGNAISSKGGKTGFFRRLFWDKPSPTLLTSPIMPATSLGHPEEDRPLSIEEYKRIQQFPDDWYIAGNLTEMYRQVGNAVPIGIGIAIGTQLFNDINCHIHKPINNFLYSRYKNTGNL